MSEPDGRAESRSEQRPSAAARLADADHQLVQLSKALLVVGAVLCVGGVLIESRWILWPGALVAFAGAVLNLVRFLPVRPFWR